MRFRSVPARKGSRASIPALGALLLSTVLAPSADAQERRTLRAAPAPAVAVDVDGRLDEAAWAGAESAVDFLQLEPAEGAPASERTEVRVLYGPASLYIGAVLHDRDPAAVERTLGRRDEFNRADWFIVAIDGYLDRRTAYAFGVNAAGVQFDAVQAGGGGGGPGGGGGGPDAPDGMDPSWDAIWTSEVAQGAEGWVVEMAIPYSMLRFPRAAGQRWGIQFSRHIPRRGEISEWPLVPRLRRSNQVAGFGDLVGIEGIAPRRNLQIQPYTVARVEARERDDEPGERVGEGEFDLGGDLKVGLGPNVTLDATINPDFGQVESDPAVLNLTAFETVFEERRPFFVEGSQIYDFEAGPGRLLYTRRIGADAPIIGAAKLSGRTGSGLSFGILAATTGDDFDPDRHYGVARLSQQLGEFSRVGGIATYLDGPFDGAARGRALAAGADWDLRLLQNRYGVEGFAALTNRTWTDGGPDPERGFAGKLWTVKRQGAWQGFVGTEVFSDDFDPNDVGQLREANAWVAIGSVEHEINGNRPFGPFQRASAELFGVQRWAYDSRLDQGLELSLSSSWTLRSFAAFELGAEVQAPFGGYDLYETRGLGPWAQPTVVGFQSEFTTDERRSWQVEPELGIEFQEGGGRGYAAGFRTDWRVSDRISLEGNLEGEWEEGVLAWTSNELFVRGAGGWAIGAESGAAGEELVPFDDAGELDRILQGVTPIGTGRYFVPVFGNRDTRALDFTMRGGYTFTPNLSLQLYGQLFVARGRYQEMQVMRSRDELAPFDPFPKRDEFAFSSLQSNTVLRWEYRPGSSLYLVWTHGRQSEDEQNPLAPWGPSPFDRSFGGQLGDTFDIIPQDVLLIKLSYSFLN